MKKATTKAAVSKPKKASTNSNPAAAGATLRFLPGWAQNLEGELRQGGGLVIDYDPERLPQYRTVHDGLPSWGLQGFVKFHPSGELVAGNLVAHVDDATGWPLVPPRPVPLSLTIPADATGMELWFKNSDVWGHEAWDSRMGQNYWFEVQPSAPAAKIKAAAKRRTSR